MSRIVDSYSESNQGIVYVVYGGDHLGQSFTGNGGFLNSVKFNIGKNGAPVGNIIAKIYAHSGTFGMSSIPTGSPLATSDNFDISTLPVVGYQLTSFSFSGENKIILTDGTYYVVTPGYDNGDASNYLEIGADGSSPTHSGNKSLYSNPSWYADSARDLCFYVYADTIISPLPTFYR